MKKISFLAATIIILAACSPKTVEVIEKVEEVETVEAVESPFPSSEIASGSQLYADNCGKCHKFKVMSDYSTEEWQKIVPNMCAKAKLDSTQENQVMQYVMWKISN